ncbi:hypothetical protein ACFLTW_04775 [Chloroflexota bacterium]
MSGFGEHGRDVRLCARRRRRIWRKILKKEFDCAELWIAEYCPIMDYAYLQHRDAGGWRSTPVKPSRVNQFRLKLPLCPAHQWPRLVKPVANVL